MVSLYYAVYRNASRTVYCVQVSLSGVATLIKSYKGFIDNIDKVFDFLTSAEFAGDPSGRAAVSCDSRCPSCV